MTRRDSLSCRSQFVTDGVGINSSISHNLIFLGPNILLVTVFCAVFQYHCVSALCCLACLPPQPLPHWPFHQFSANPSGAPVPYLPITSSALVQVHSDFISDSYLFLGSHTQFVQLQQHTVVCRLQTAPHCSEETPTPGNHFRFHFLPKGSMWTCKGLNIAAVDWSKPHVIYLVYAICCIWGEMWFKNIIDGGFTRTTLQHWFYLRLTSWEQVKSQISVDEIQQWWFRNKRTGSRHSKEAECLQRRSSGRRWMQHIHVFSAVCRNDHGVRECPDYVSDGPNSCHFDSDHTAIWTVYCMNVTAVTARRNYTSPEHCLDVADIGTTSLPYCFSFTAHEIQLVVWSFLQVKNLTEGHRQPVIFIISVEVMI